jgi:hypothetical protein
VTGACTTPAGWQLGGSYKAVAVSDGNRGSEFQLRIGHLFFDEVTAGYEYMYSDYLHQAPWVPFTDHAKQLYYSPQNLESHAAWVEWQAQKDEEVAFSLSGRVGWLPAYQAALREVAGDLNYRPTTQLLLSGKFSVGNTFRSDGGYNYVSLVISTYWSVL